MPLRERRIFSAKAGAISIQPREKCENEKKHRPDQSYPGSFKMRGAYEVAKQLILLVAFQRMPHILLPRQRKVPAGGRRSGDEINLSDKLNAN